MHNMEIHNVYKDSNHYLLEREKAVKPTFVYNRTQLTQDQQNAYNATWTKTTLVHIEGQPPTALTIGPIDWGNLLS